MKISQNLPSFGCMIIYRAERKFTGLRAIFYFFWVGELRKTFKTFWGVRKMVKIFGGTINFLFFSFLKFLRLDILMKLF